MAGENLHLFATGWSGQPYWSFLPTGACLLLWGKNIFAIRMLSVIAGSLNILFLYLLARETLNRDIAIAAAAFLVAFPYHLQFSRIGVHNINDGLMITLVLWLIFRAVRTGKVTTYLAAGIFTGFTFYTYVGTRLVLLIGLAALGYSIIRKKGYLRSHLAHIAIFALALFITIAPISYSFLVNQDTFMTRIKQENILFNGWLQGYALTKGISVPQVLLEQVSKTVLVFVAHNANSGFLNFPMPYLTVLGAVLFLIGLGIAFRYIYQPRYLILLIWFWSVVILGGILTLNPPASTRMVMTTPAVALLVAIGMWGILDVLERLKIHRGWILSLTVIILLVFTAQNAYFYFKQYKEGFYFRDANGEVAMEAGLELKSLGQSYSLYLLGSPRMFVTFPTFYFLAPANPKYDVTSEEIDASRSTISHGLFIVSTPQNVSQLKKIARQYPDGNWEIIMRKSQPEVLYYAYIVQSSDEDQP